MTESMPEWAKQLLDDLTLAVEFQGFATLEGRYFAPAETSCGCGSCRDGAGTFGNGGGRAA